MQKLLLLCLCIGFLTTANAQNKPPNDATDTTIVSIDSASVEDIKNNSPDNIPTISLDDNDFRNADNSSASSQLTAGRDPFYSEASFNFNFMRFRLRGYDASLSSVYINGISMNGLDDGYADWNLWSGLNDVFRNRDVSFGIKYNTFAFGSISATTNLDVRASKQQPQTLISTAFSNRLFHRSFSFTHSTGIIKNGWAFTTSINYRYANEGYVPGTFHNGASLFFAADKKIGQKQTLSFIAFASPSVNGRSTAATEEMINLAGTHYYNASWGYQNGRKRNASVAGIHQPVFMLSHEYKISTKTNLMSTVMYSFGERSLSNIDWYNTPDPRPDYYRNLPSYYEANDNPVVAQQIKAAMSNNEDKRQLAWDNFYNINRNNEATIEDANGISSNTIRGNRSYYILGERIVNEQRFAANVVANTTLSEHIQLTAGISFQSARNHYFQRINDLLGGQFWVNLNSFAQRDFPNDKNAYQNDLQNPNRIVYKGDKYGYDYNININKPEEWLQLVFHEKKIDAYVAVEVSQTKYWRVGNVQNGLFPTRSFGKSAQNIFDNDAVKGGITYKINGRNYLYANGALLSLAPYFKDAYVSQRTRDDVQAALRNETVQSIEAGYVLNAPKIKLRITAYYTSMQHGFNVNTFYYDAYQTFVNYALSNINRLYFGSEWGAEMKLTSRFTINAVAAVGRGYYNSRQHAVVTVDNTAQTVKEATVYANNFRIAGTPQEAYSVGITYRSPKYWFVNIKGVYCDQMWLSFNPLRRTYAATDGMNDANSETTKAIIAQTRLPSQFEANLYAGYSWRIRHSHSSKRKKPVYAVMSASVNNLANNKNIIAGGYEQLRYDFSASPEQNLKLFPPKYYYAYGLNYSFNCALRF